MSTNKSRYMENASSNDRYSDRPTSSSGSGGGWGNMNNPPPSSVKPFGGLSSVPANDPWSAMSKPPADNGNWNRMDHQNQDRYDRTYNERKSSSQFIDSGLAGSNSRPSSFISNRPQDRYAGNSMSSRFDSSRF